VPRKGSQRARDVVQKQRDQLVGRLLVRRRWHQMFRLVVLRPRLDVLVELQTIFSRFALQMAPVLNPHGIADALPERA
jgi:hypothetical protein